MAGFVAACEKADLPGALACMADVPEFRYADPAGNLPDFAQTKHGSAEWFDQSCAQRVVTQSQEIAVPGPDATLVVWPDALEHKLKDGPLHRADPDHASFLFKRLGAAWKFAYDHYSASPSRPMSASAANP